MNDITIAISSIQHHPAVCARYAAWRYPLLCTVFYVNSKAKDLLLQSRNITIFKPFLTQTISVTFLQNIASAGTQFFLLQIIGPTHVDFTAYHPDQTLFDLELILCG